MDPFISRTDLGNFLRRDLTTDEAALIVVDAACDACRIVAEQDFNLTEDDEIRLDGQGTDWLLLPQLPVEAVSSVVVVKRDTDDDVLDGEDSGGDGDYLFDVNGALIRLGDVWPRGRRNVKVTYSHGYDEIPSAVRMVALTAAARAYEQGIVQFETLGERQVRYGQQIASDFGSTEYLILSRYRP